jgi:hypothetical protein
VLRQLPDPPPQLPTFGGRGDRQRRVPLAAVRGLHLAEAVGSQAIFSYARPIHCCGTQGGAHA